MEMHELNSHISKVPDDLYYMVEVETSIKNSLYKILTKKVVDLLPTIPATKIRWHHWAEEFIKDNNCSIALADDAHTEISMDYEAPYNQIAAEFVCFLSRRLAFTHSKRVVELSDILDSIAMI
jgi:hypothetical protein